MFTRTRAFLAIVIAFTSLNLYGQEKKQKYFSSEEKEYYSSFPPFTFKPADRDALLAFSLPYIRIKELSHFTPFESIFHWSPEKEKEFEKRYSEEYLPNQTEGTSGISKTDIIKRGVLDGRQAFLYTDNKYDGNFDSGKGIWIALYDDNLKQWNKYYTGLAEYEPLYLKWESDHPLFKDSSTLQIEAAFLRKVESENLKEPLMQYDFELIKDGVTVEFDLEMLSADTDGDGLTDIIEKKMSLNHLQKDTDGDGVVDALDPNPRFNLPRTERTALYEALLTERYSLAFSSFRKIPFLPTSKISLLSADSTETYLIVSDKKDVHSISKIDHRLIILTSEEYKRHKDLYASTFQQYDISPLFKVDNARNLYKMHISIGMGGIEYLIKKVRGGWKVKILSRWVV